jgi:hypothetical protein
MGLATVVKLWLLVAKVKQPRFVLVSELLRSRCSETLRSIDDEIRRFRAD